jgi:hypothetical protein
MVEFVWDESKNQFKRFFYNEKAPNNCLIVKFDHQRRIWISFLKKGVHVLDQEGRILASYEQAVFYKLGGLTLLFFNKYLIQGICSIS